MGVHKQPLLKYHLCSIRYISFPYIPRIYITTAYCSWKPNILFLSLATSLLHKYIALCHNSVKPESTCFFGSSFL